MVIVNIPYIHHNKAMNKSSALPTTSLLDSYVYPSLWKRLQQNWKTFQLICLYHRRIEKLEGLIDWARRKRLREVQAAYLRRYHDDKRRLFRLEYNYPWSSRLARLLLGDMTALLPNFRSLRRLIFSYSINT